MLFYRNHQCGARVVGKDQEPHLTPTLSPPSDGAEREKINITRCWITFSLSHRMGEGRGEGAL